MGKSATSILVKGRPIRWVVIRGFESYLVFYRIGDAVEVLRVVHGARDLRRLLSKRRRSR